MRIVTWNCQMAFDKKLDAFLGLDADVAVVPECSEKSALALREHGYETLWFGSISYKGLGIFRRGGWSIRALQQPQQKWVVPIEVDAPTPFRLIAVWACQVGTKKADHYIGQVYQTLMSNPHWFDGTPIVLAGDLNSNKQWDSERAIGNHSKVVKILAERGLISGYHRFFGEEQGAETRPTIHLHRHQHRPFHIDYIFIPAKWATHLKSVEVGGYDEWSKLSDHCPVAVEVDDKVSYSRTP